jgi:hypothetical protein
MMKTNKEQLPSKATAVCKVCGLTLQGMENEVEDICVDCLADLCFPPSNNYNIKEGCIRQSTDNPIEKEETDE